jgi:catechol 2,3-dioxygenase-like lactoylglutathione lyase family enzyme
MRFIHVTLRAPSAGLPGLADFYGRALGLSPARTGALPSEAAAAGSAGIALAVGETVLEFLPSPDRAFYHFALLVPGNRFDEALRWASERTDVLRRAGSPEVVFDFRDWNARACYIHDPAGNIVELIAHRGVGETSARGPFRARELIGLSELGLVGDRAAMADQLRLKLALAVWDGNVDAPGSLAFVGEKARTLILVSPGHRWLPTGRSAERHEIDARIGGHQAGAASLEGSCYRISCSGPSGAV